MASIKDKTAKVDLSRISAMGEARRVAEREAGLVHEPRTAIGQHASALYQDTKIADENERLRAELDAFKGSEPTKRLAPNIIRASRWANRNEDSFLSKDFEALKAEIESAGGNVQPIKVRPLLDVPGEYEIVFGHRRHRACLELGIEVLATVENLTDAELFAQMDRENRQRADLRPYEQGLMYAKALDAGLFPSNRKLAEALGVDLGGVGKLLALARLPAAVLNAFESPLDIQFAWGSVLSAAVQKDPDFVLNRAREIREMSPRLKAKAVFQSLTQQGVDSIYSPEIKPILLTGKSGGKAKVTYDPIKQALGVSIVGVSEKRLAELGKLVKEFLEKS